MGLLSSAKGPAHVSTPRSRSLSSRRAPSWRTAPGPRAPYLSRQGRPPRIPDRVALEHRVHERELALTAMFNAAERHAEVEGVRADRLAALGYTGNLPEFEYIRPIRDYHLSAGFGLSGPLWESVHTGLDFGAASGTDLVALADGTVTEVAYAGGVRHPHDPHARGRDRHLVLPPADAAGLRGPGRSRSANRSGWWARPGTPPVRTCTSRSGPTEVPRSTRQPGWPATAWHPEPPAGMSPRPVASPTFEVWDASSRCW
ncbi:M23 family metallopeptidase [Nocardioides sp. B-3]|uniref:M23 family metallopeptidase n=1 Tax=Nocardioides sp. B-3 TaxID=2895565 RepID=UPI002153333C|nr:M23 family metallopeptidase [Nocardioides sp. B-3]UUZ59013.1 M23 family metallopeptidase [Nocardioides sp. B-3]